MESLPFVYNERNASGHDCERVDGIKEVCNNRVGERSRELPLDVVGE